MMNSDDTSFRARPSPVPGWLWLGAIIVLGTLAAYWPVYSAGFIWDDDAYVTENPLLTAPDGFSRIWFSAHLQSQYFPMAYTTLRIEHALWGLNPLGYHLVNVCLHAGNALLVWGLLRRLLVPGAWLAAAIFALHPVQVETVAWVTELKNTESTLFYLLTLYAWLRFCGGKGEWNYLLAFGLCALALFAKTTACTLPAAMLVVLWISGQRVGWRRVAQTLPFLGLGVGMGLLSVWWEQHLGNYAPKYHLLGGPLDRLLIATHALWFYAGKVFWPAQLTFSYPRWDINAADWTQYVWLAGCVAVAVVLWRRRQVWDGKVAAALFFFAAALSPMLGFIPLYTFYYSYVADHYQYLACLGLAGLAAGLGAVSCQKIVSLRPFQTPVAGAILLVLGLLTWRQCGIYRDLETLWTDTLAKNPQSWMAHVNLGRLQSNRGQFDQAEAHYRSAMAINSSNESIRYNYANMLARSGRLDAAVEQYRQVLAMAPDKAEAHNNLGVLLNRLHHPDEAVAEYELALFYQPDYADAYYNLGNALSAEQRLDMAVLAYERAARLKPESETFRKRLRAVMGGGN